MPIRSAPFSIRLDLDMLRALDALAEEDNRSRNNLIETILKEWLIQNGKLKRKSFPTSRGV